MTPVWAAVGLDLARVVGRSAPVDDQRCAEMGARGMDAHAPGRLRAAQWTGRLRCGHRPQRFRTPPRYPDRIEKDYPTKRRAGGEGHRPRGRRLLPCRWKRKPIQKAWRPQPRIESPRRAGGEEAPRFLPVPVAAEDSPGSRCEAAGTRVGWILRPLRSAERRSALEDEKKAASPRGGVPATACWNPRMGFGCAERRLATGIRCRPMALPPPGSHRLSGGRRERGGAPAHGTRTRDQAGDDPDPVELGPATGGAGVGDLARLADPAARWRSPGSGEAARAAARVWRGSGRRGAPGRLPGVTAGPGKAPLRKPWGTAGTSWRAGRDSNPRPPGSKPGALSG